MKFSMEEKDGRYNLSKGDALGNWMIKIEDERKYVLKLGKTKDRYAVTATNFQSWTDSADIP